MTDKTTFELIKEKEAQIEEPPFGPLYLYSQSKGSRITTRN